MTQSGNRSKVNSGQGFPATETIECIRSVYQDYGYVLDTHTAVAMDVYDKYVIYTGDLTPTVIVSTASPFKFNQSVAKALLKMKRKALMNLNF